MSPALLANLRAVLESLPDRVPPMPETDGVDSDVEALGQSIATLAHRIGLRQQQDAMMANITSQVMQGMYLEEVLDHVYEGFKGLIPYDRIGFALLEEGGRVARARWARSEREPTCLNRGFAARLEGSSLQHVMDSGRPRILNDLLEYAEQHAVSHATALILKEGIRSSLTCPLIAQGKPVGFLFFSSTQPNQYATIHTSAFERLAGLLSAVVERSTLYEQLAQANAALREARDALQLEATHDALTGILNRRAILAALNLMLAPTRRRDAQGAVLLADIDHFKQINDEHGHPAADEVLRVVAQRISSTLRTGDWVGRYGGEEFLICLDDCTLDGSRLCAERILALIRDTPVTIAGGAVRVTISVGLVHRARLKGEATAGLIQAADQALYQAKHDGRDRMVMGQGVA